MYPSKGNDNCNISTMVQQTRLACNIAYMYFHPCMLSFHGPILAVATEVRLETYVRFFPLLLIFWFGVN